MLTHAKNRPSVVKRWTLAVLLLLSLLLGLAAANQNNPPAGFFSATPAVYIVAGDPTDPPDPF